MNAALHGITGHDVCCSLLEAGMLLCRRRQSADDMHKQQQTDREPEAGIDAELTQQQQRLIDLLQLRSDELSAENGELRMQITRADRKLPGQLQSKHPISPLQTDYSSKQLPGQLQSGLQQHAPDSGSAMSASLRPFGGSQAGLASHADRYVCSLWVRTQYDSLASTNPQEGLPCVCSLAAT